MSFFKRFHLMRIVLPAVLAILLVKLAIHELNLEFVTIDGLIPSVVAGAIFLIGFLLSHVMGHYKEAERTPGDIRAALEAIHDDVCNFARSRPDFDLRAFRETLKGIVADLQAGLGLEAHHSDLLRAEERVDSLSPIFSNLEELGLSDRYVVRIKSEQDRLRQAVFRIAYIQRMESLPSVHVLVETLVFACLALILFIRTSGSYESFIILGFVSYLFVFAVCLIQHLEEPFRTGEDTVDDVSLFLLRDFVAKLERADAEGQGRPPQSAEDPDPQTWASELAS
jgi:hypothetical protein